MTLERYTPAQLDHLALRLLDTAAAVRQLSARARVEGLEQVELHDKKALEFIARLEDWIHRAEANVQLAIRRTQGARRAKAAKQRL